MFHLLQYIALSYIFGRGLQCTSPATTNELEASEVLHLPHGIISMSKIKTDDSFAKRLWTFQNVVQLHATQNDLQNHLPFWPTPANVLATFRKCHACHADENVSNMDRAQLWARRASKTRTSEKPKLRPPSCASLPSRNAHGHLKKELFYAKNFQWKCLRPKPRRSSCASLRSQNAHGQWIGLRENLQETMVFTIKYGVFL